MSQLSLPAPPFPTILAGIINNGVRQKAEACNQNGLGTANWLLQFDPAAGTITTGGARSVATPGTTPYAFLTSPADDIGNLSVAPVTIEAKPDASGAFSSSKGVQLNVPLFLDDTGTDAILLPLREFVIKSGTLSASKNCIGQYNAKGLDPQNQCDPDNTQPGFTGGATFEGFIALEDADEVLIKSLNQSLCAVLTGESDGGNPKKCKRDAESKIQSKGNWCSPTNAAADASCADAFRVSGTFAASSVKIK